MQDARPTVQRSFRLGRALAAELDAEAGRRNESRNSLVERLLRESLRLQTHPLIRFRTGAAGRREPYLVGTRTLVRQLIAAIVPGDTDDLGAVAADFALSEASVEAALAYYADHRAEVDEDRRWAERAEDEARGRAERIAALRSGS